MLPFANNGKSASAAVELDEVGAVTWESVADYQYYQTGFTSNNTYGKPLTLGDMSTTLNATAGACSFGADTKTAIAAKSVTTLKTYVTHYVCFKATINVPALTEYTVVFSEAMYLNGIGGGAHVWGDFYAFGDEDESAGVTFGYCSQSATPTGYVTPGATTRINNHVKSESDGSNKNYGVVKAWTETYTNDSGMPKSYSAYFGFYTGTAAGQSYKYTYNSSLTMSTKITVTALAAPTADKVQAEYDVNGNAFKFTYDQDRVEVKSVSYKAADGEASDITSATAIDSDGNCRLTNGAGTYTFTFKIKDICGAVWNSSTNDQTDKTVTVTITPKQVAPPTVSETEQTYNPSGNKFPVTGYDGTKMTVSGLTYNNGNLEAAGAGTYTVTFKPKEGYAWSSGGTSPKTVTLTVKAKTLSVSWTTNKTEIKKDAESFFVMLPELSSTVTAETKGFLSEVRYYPKDNCTVDDDNNITVSGGAVALNDLEKDKTYYAVVQPDNSKVGNNYAFDGNLYYLFSTNDNRTRVVLSLTESESAYDAKQKEITAKAVRAEDNGELTLSLQLEYYSGETKLAGAPTDAGEYKVIVLISGTDAEHYTASVTEFTYTIRKAEPKLDPHFVGTGLYAGGSLPALSAGSNGTAGTYAWDNPDEKLGSGERSYGYTFTPTDTKNYKTVQDTVKLSAAEATITSITATFNFPETNGDGSEFVIYDSWKPDDLRKYLTVTGTKDDGSTQENLTGYTFTQNKLTAGENVTLTVKYGTAAPLNVTVPKVVKCELAEITAVCSPEETVYTSTDIEELKQWLAVTGKNNDGSVYSGTINGSDCTLKFGEDDKLTAGTITVDVEYKGIKTTFNVTVEEVELESIKAEWRADKAVELNKLIASVTEEKLKELITVTGTNNDKSDFGEITEYTLKKTVKGTTLTVTVTFGGLTTQLTREVKQEEKPTVKTPIEIPDFADLPKYNGKEIDILTAIGWSDYVDFVEISGTRTATDVSDEGYTVTVTIKDTNLCAWADGDEGTTKSFDWNIAPAELKVKWNSKGTLDRVDGGYDGSVEGLFDYTYYDEDGKEVSKTSDKDGNEVINLEEGKTYTVVATLKDSVKNNFTMSDETMTLISSGKFTAKSAETDDSGFMKVLKDNLPIIIGVALGLLLLLALILFLALRRRRADDYYDDDYDDEDDDEDDDYDDEDY